ncbi:hypothetical protein DF161_29140 [Burkholderia stagnalis]|uniref:hypothetical protein n=1 Tax=Burkholderia stagnalis TaxID=1503054 RepID=UPI000F5A29FE|nr:hypothetical protein [Burkholderia stagnalis]RQQ08388.1 hypothetical protein DF161_29140 [Burkholderia stagnalis]
MIHPGQVLFHKDFKFADGDTKDKYLVVLGKSAQSVVVAKTTSKGSRYRNDFGCQSANRYPAFYLPKGSCCFQMCTWICLDEFYELTVGGGDGLSSRMISGQINRFGLLTDGIVRDIQFCAMTCDDITSAHEDVIRSSLAPDPSATSNAVTQS